MKTTSKVAGILLVGLSGMVAAADEAATDGPGLDVRVMTFNIKQQNPANQKDPKSPHHWQQRAPLVFEIIREHSPDILGLQEAYQCQLDDFTEALPGFGKVGEGRDGGTQGEHSSILYRRDRFRVDDSGTFWLSDTPGKRSKTWGHFYFRICTWSRFLDKESKQAFYVFNTHFDHQSQEAREKSARLVAQRIHDREHPDPFILTGDFNADEDNPVITYLTGNHADASPIAAVDSFRLVHPEAKDVGTGNRLTGYVEGPKSDYVFVPPSTKVTEARIIRKHRNGQYPSDHFPVTASLRFLGGSLKPSP